jgi:hypothetical protein
MVALFLNEIIIGFIFNLAELFVLNGLEVTNGTAYLIN